jgi:hypothetical protein
MTNITDLTKKHSACIVGGGVQTGSTRHVGLLYLPRVIVRMENLVEWMAGETEVQEATYF